MIISTVVMMLPNIITTACDVQHSLQARSAISNQQKNQQEKAALQDSLTTKREEVQQLQEDKAAALKQIDELDKQLADGKVCHALLCMLRSQCLPPQALCGLHTPCAAHAVLV